MRRGLYEDVKMKLKAPENSGGANVAGVAYNVALDGSINAAAAHVDALRSHGFVDWIDDPELPVKIVEVEKPIIVEKLVEVPVEDNPNEIPPVDADEFDGMNRGGLFAWLKAQGVSVSPPITNDELRAKARDVKATLAAAAAPALPSAIQIVNTETPAI